ncbi:unnamed protein product [Peronospora effusa]|nr:unnamed protein product [Peronospora effusa]
MEDNKTVLCLAPYDLMQHYMEKFMTHAYNQSVHAKKWIEEGKLFTEYAEKLLTEQRDAANFQVVQPSNDGIIFVTESRSFPPRRYRVDLNQCVCSCAYLLQMGVPCRHFLAVLAFFKRLSEEENFMDACFRVTTFAEQYDTQRTGSIELLLDSELQENHTVRAPVVARKRGRPKSKPFSENDEVLMMPAVASVLLNGNTSLLLDSEDAQEKRQCSTCGLTGHSKRTCKQNARASSPLHKVAPDMIF